jgi:diguanylate cyclase (GGDEF)-like protein
MNQNNTPQHYPGGSSLWQRFISASHRLTSPNLTSQEIPDPEQRRAGLLSWVLFSIFLLILAAIVLVLLVDSLTSPRGIRYLGLIVGLLIIIVMAILFNRAGHHYLASWLAVICGIAGPWGSMLIDPTILHGDLVPLTYVFVSIMLSSILLSPLITIILASVQWVGLLMIPFLVPSSSSSNWPSLLALIFFTSVLSTLASTIIQRNLTQIDYQQQQLEQKETLLREQSIRDYLTNLFNRRYLEETLEREINRAERKKYSVGVLMIDIDHYKNYNDTLGHAAGDIILQELGKLLTSHVRLADIACRYGGDEFVLVIPEASLEVAKERAESLRAKMKHLNLKDKVKSPNTVTISVGVAVFPDHGSTGTAVLKAADDALYRAKNKGRDRVVVADTIH